MAAEGMKAPEGKSSPIGLNATPDQLSAMEELQRQELALALAQDTAPRGTGLLSAFFGEATRAQEHEVRFKQLAIAQQSNRLQLEVAAQAKAQRNAALLGIARENKLTEAQTQYLLENGDLKNFGEAMSAASKGQVDYQTRDTEVQQKQANVRKTEADILQAKASAVSSYASANQANANAAKTQVETKRLLQPQEGDWIKEKQLDGTVKTVQMKKLPEGVGYELNADGTMSMGFDPSKSDSANKAAFDSMREGQQLLTNMQPNAMEIQRLLPKITAMGDISDAKVASARGKKAAGIASQDDMDIVAFDDATKAISYQQLKPNFGGNVSEGERTAYTSVSATAASPQDRRLVLSSLTLGTVKSAQMYNEIMQKGIQQGMAPAAAKAAADAATRGVGATEGFRIVLNSGKSDLIKATYLSLRKSGMSDEGIQKRLGADAAKLRNYL